MARKRMIDPSIWVDRGFGRLSLPARVLFIACVSNADDDGRIIANPVYLRSIAFLYDKLTDRKVKSLIDEVVTTLSSIHRYEIGDEEYIHFVRWEKYQNQRADRRMPSLLPPCPQCDANLSTKRQPSVSQDDDKMASSRQPSDGQSAAEVKLSKDKLSEENTPPPIIPRPSGSGDSPPSNGEAGSQTITKQELLERMGMNQALKRRGASHEWQAKACWAWKELGLKGSPSTGFFKVFRSNWDHPGLLDSAYRFVVDANARDPEKLFYWKMNQLTSGSG